MAETYGTIGILPLKEWDATTQYDLLNLVSYNGSSYVAHTKPPVGTLPTNAAYWQVSAQGGSKATADAPGVVQPDGTTTEVDAAGVLSAKQATQTTTGVVKGSAGIKVGADGSIDVDTTFTQAATLANIVAKEAFGIVLGKVSKAIATTMNLDQNALLKNMLTSIDVNDPNKIPTAAYIHTLVERIGMGTELTAGANLTAAVENLNRDLDSLKSYRLDTSDTNYDTNTNNWYKSIPQETNFVLYLQCNGNIRRVEGYKADDLYGYMRMSSYDSAAATVERRMYNGAWSKWIPYTTTSDLDNCVKTSVAADYCNLYIGGGYKLRIYTSGNKKIELCNSSWDVVWAI